MTFRVETTTEPVPEDWEPVTPEASTADHYRLVGIDWISQVDDERLKGQIASIFESIPIAVAAGDFESLPLLARGIGERCLVLGSRMAPGLSPDVAQVAALAQREGARVGYAQGIAQKVAQRGTTAAVVRQDIEREPESGRPLTVIETAADGTVVTKRLRYDGDGRLVGTEVADA